MIHTFNGYLKEMEELGYRNSFEVINAMDYGLPQKRERVFTISMLGEKFNFSEMKKRPMEPLIKFLGEYEMQHIMTQPSMLRRIRKTQSSFSGRLRILKDYAYTITTKQMRCPNSGIIDLGNGKYRYLTEQECWRLQGFDDADYYAALKANPGKDGCLNGALYKQAGNSIPVPILEEIFRVALR